MLSCLDVELCRALKWRAEGVPAAEPQGIRDLRLRH